MKEADFQRQIEHLLTLYGWRWFHAPDNLPTKSGRKQNIKKGFPDLVAVKGGRVVYVELKKDGNYPSPEQRAWLADLHAAGQEVTVWWPRDLPTAVRCLGPQQEPLVLPVRYRSQSPE